MKKTLLLLLTITLITSSINAQTPVEYLYEDCNCEPNVYGPQVQQTRKFTGDENCKAKYQKTKGVPVQITKYVYYFKAMVVHQGNLTGAPAGLFNFGPPANKRDLSEMRIVATDILLSQNEINTWQAWLDQRVGEGKLCTYELVAIPIDFTKKLGGTTYQYQDQ